jgi:TRAP transporter 4TM/12TM fusion protein
MAEITDIPYTTIALSAIFPAVLYFIGIFFNVHFEAKKQGLEGLPKETLPRFLPLFFAKGYLFLPIVILIVMMALGFTPARAAIFGIGGAFVLSFIRKDTRFTPARLVDALTTGSRNTLSIGMACAVAGCVVGMVTLTGIGQLLLGQLTGLVSIPFFVNTGTSLLLALLLTMVCCLVLGMGIPTTANYIIMATITAPMVLRAGELTGMTIPLLAAHMFVFYYGLLADVTPPVALASYAASAIAKCEPMRAMLKGTQLALTAFIIPYFFVFSPSILMIGPDLQMLNVTFLGMTQIIITAIIGMFSFGSGLVGFMFRTMTVPWRLYAVAAGIMTVNPRPITTIIGLTLIAVLIAVQIIGVRKGKA